MFHFFYFLALLPWQRMSISIFYVYRKDVDSDVEFL